VKVHETTKKEVGMKRFVALLASVLVVGLVSGCATPYPAGCGYLKLKLPVDATGNKLVGQMKSGTAECKSYCGIVAIGDASIDTAARNGGIKQIQYVDWEVESILGIIGKYKVTVYGE
jgi:hypothetical protein